MSEFTPTILKRVNVIACGYPSRPSPDVPFVCTFTGREFKCHGTSIGNTDIVDNFRALDYTQAVF
jgi:hypothetical protein